MNGFNYDDHIPGYGDVVSDGVVFLGNMVVTWMMRDYGSDGQLTHRVMTIAEYLDQELYNEGWGENYPAEWDMIADAPFATPLNYPDKWDEKTELERTYVHDDDMPHSQEEADAMYDDEASLRWAESGGAKEAYYHGRAVMSESREEAEHEAWGMEQFEAGLRRAGNNPPADEIPF